MTRVLNVISDSNIGGAGKVLINYLQFADTARFETHVALPENSLLSPELRRYGAIVHELPGLRERSYHRDDVKTLAELIRAVSPQLVHTHGAFSGRIAAKRLRVPVVYTRHSAFPVPSYLRYPPGRWANKLLNEYYADHIIAVSNAAKQNLTDGGISPKRITTMMNGVAPLERPSEERLLSLRRELKLGEGEFVTGILARVEEYKGHATIIEAARLLRENGHRFKILVAGTGSYENEVRELIKQHGLEDTVLMLGFRGDVECILSLLNVQINASTGTDTSSLSILEGFSLGVPAIVSDYGGNPQLVGNGENGFIFPQRDAAALAEIIERMLSDSALCEKTGARAREIYDERFTGRVFARNVEAVYKKVLGR